MEKLLFFAICLLMVRPSFADDSTHIKISQIKADTTRLLPSPSDSIHVVIDGTTRTIHSSPTKSLQSQVNELNREHQIKQVRRYQKSFAIITIVGGVLVGTCEIISVNNPSPALGYAIAITLPITLIAAGISLLYR
jgi:hypothetical protein